MSEPAEVLTYDDRDPSELKVIYGLCVVCRSHRTAYTRWLDGVPVEMGMTCPNGHDGW